MKHYDGKKSNINFKLTLIKKEFYYEQKKMKIEITSKLIFS